MPWPARPHAEAVADPWPAAAAVLLAHAVLGWAVLPPPAPVAQRPAPEPAVIEWTVLPPAAAAPSPGQPLAAQRDERPATPRDTPPPPPVPTPVPTPEPGPVDLRPAPLATASAEPLMPTATRGTAPPRSEGTSESQTAEAGFPSVPRGTGDVGPAPAPASPPPTLPSASVQYRVLPAIAVPAASRRAGEQGTVWLRVHVGRDGLPREITVHRSSGHQRLDAQALSAMASARFQPQTQQGEPIEWVVIAPLRYELE